jgi:hypothetical protein
VELTSYHARDVGGIAVSPARHHRRSGRTSR